MSTKLILGLTSYIIASSFSVISKAWGRDRPSGHNVREQRGKHLVLRLMKRAVACRKMFRVRARNGLFPPKTTKLKAWNNRYHKLKLEASPPPTHIEVFGPFAAKQRSMFTSNLFNSSNVFKSNQYCSFLSRSDLPISTTVLLPQKTWKSPPCLQTVKHEGGTWEISGRPLARTM